MLMETACRSETQRTPPPVLMSLLRNTHDLSSVSELKCTDLPQFDALQAQANMFRIDDKLHLRNLCNNAARCSGFVTVHTASAHRRMVLDYSRQRVVGETMELLFDLADAVGMTNKRYRLQTGQLSSVHHVLRMPASFPIQWKREMKAHGDSHDDTELLQDGASLLNHVHSVRERIRDFSDAVRSGKNQGSTGKPFTALLCISVTGGSHVGPACVASALGDPNDHRVLRFVTTVDPFSWEKSIAGLDPSNTLVLVTSPTFADSETTLMLKSVKKWLESNSHLVAISDNSVRCRQNGVPRSQIFPYMAMCGRYTICSPVGILPIALHLGFDTASNFLDGAHAMDEHFFHSPLYDNIPVILGLLGVWNSTFLGYSCRAVLPYSQALELFPSYVNKIEMESNGKRVSADGSPLLHECAQVGIGQAGPTAQHSWFQLLHQGREIPVEFIAFMESPAKAEATEEGHDELMAHFFAQPDALAYGKTMVDLIQEEAPETLREHMLFPGNRPSLSLMLSKLDAFALGQLTALYEHRTTVQGFIWSVNSFDLYGNELGNTLAKRVRSQLRASRSSGVSVQGFNSSTSKLLEHYLRHHKLKKSREAAASALSSKAIPETK